MDAITKFATRIPVVPITVLAVAWLSYTHYDFLNSPTSELGTKLDQIKVSEQGLAQEKTKLLEGEEFFRNLDAIKTRIRQLTAQLDSSKASLSSEVDIAGFVSIINTEAKNVRLSVTGIKPETEVKKDYYIEVPFTVTLKGAYVQLLVFFDRIAKIPQVIRISDFEMKPSGNAFTKYVELEANVKLVTYRYVGTSADEVVKKDEMKDLSMKEVHKQ